MWIGHMRGCILDYCGSLYRGDVMTCGAFWVWTRIRDMSIWAWWLHMSSLIRIRRLINVWPVSLIGIGGINMRSRPLIWIRWIYMSLIRVLGISMRTDSLIRIRRVNLRADSLVWVVLIDIWIDSLIWPVCIRILRIWILIIRILSILVSTRFATRRYWVLLEKNRLNNYSLMWQNVSFTQHTYSHTSLHSSSSSFFADTNAPITSEMLKTNKKNRILLINTSNFST